jgi:prostaglandin-H2 D-isomerase / glutathione transferase
MPKYTLTYFNGRGRAEITRLIFAAAGADYVDERVADWPNGKDKSPLGQLPYLTVDGVKLPQSISIARFVAKELNLAGRGNLEQAKVDSVVDTIIELYTAYYGKVFPAKQEERVRI